MHVRLAGINHSTTPINVREKAAISAERLPDSLSLLRLYLPHGIILSTCNRTEVYTVDRDGRRTEEACLNFLRAHLDISHAELRQHVYIIKDEAAVEHLFSVTCGLNSMIVGEYEVLGQVGSALDAAEKAAMVNLPLHHIFQCAVRTGRRVREETGISRNALSVSSVAMDMAGRIISDLDRCKLLVIGAGEAGELVGKVAKERGVSRIVVANRTQERAENLAATLGGIPVSLYHLAGELSTADIVVTCAGAPHRILELRQVEEAMSNRPELPLVIIDIAVPRDVEPEVKQTKNVFLYDIDDLTGISALNREQREGEIDKAREIIATEISEFASWWQELEVRPVISALMEKAEDIRRNQLQKTIKKLRPLSEEEQDDLEAMTKSIVTKILKDPVQSLKMNGNGDDNYAEVISKLFRLELEKRG